MPDVAAVGGARSRLSPPQMPMPSVDEHRALKRVSLEFRDVASRTLRSDADNARSNLVRLLSFLRRTPVLADEVARAPRPGAEDAAATWTAAREQQQRVAWPDDPAEELGAVHATLEFLAGSSEEFWHLCYYYGGVQGMQECIDEVLNDVVDRYVGHLRRVIEIALLDSGDPAYSGSRNVHIRVDGGTNQVTVAQDQARVHAVQQAGPAPEALLAVATELSALAGTLSSEPERRDVTELAATIQEEVARPTPSRFTLRKVKEGLEGAAAAVGAATTIGTKAVEAATLIGQWLHHLPT